MSTVDFYDVLNVPHDSTQEVISRSYQKLVKKYHPDKKGGNSELYELITHSYSILKNPKTRAEYDNLFRISQKVSKDHEVFASDFDAYKEMQEAADTPEARKEARVKFQQEYEDMDLKHNFDRSKLNDPALTRNEMTQRLEDMKLAREQDEIEFTPDNLFAGGKFNNAKFQAAFDLMHDTGFEVVERSGSNPDAFTSFGSGYIDSNYSSINQNIEDIYLEDDDDHMAFDGQAYGNVNKINKPKRTLTADDMKDVKEADYTEGHDKLPEGYKKTLEEMMADLEKEREDLMEMPIGDYSTDADMGGYSIFKDVGITSTAEVMWDNDESIRDRYKKLLEFRKNENKN